MELPTIGLRNGATFLMSLRSTDFITLRINIRVFVSSESERLRLVGRILCWMAGLMDKILYTTGTESWIQLFVNKDS